MVEVRIRAIVGLGNPGAEYLRTRHNLGFWFVDILAAERRADFRSARRLHGVTAKVTIDGHDVLLVKPDTYMNRSGIALRALADYFKYSPREILVVHDDLDLPVGTVRCKRDGGHGGHNGLRDIIRHLGAEFPRLRIGIGHPEEQRPVLDYVLGIPSREEEELLMNGIAAAHAELPHLLAGDYAAAMRMLHRREAGT